MKEANFYSGMKKSNEEKSLGTWYSSILKPPFIIIAGILIFIVVNYHKIGESIGKNDNDGLLFLLLCIISIVAGIRAYQSFYLAKIDYSTIKIRKRDNLTFAAVYSFLTISLLAGLHDKIILLYAIYTIISTLATLNFWDLFLGRLEKQKNELDYICEKRIQLFNAIVFSIITVLLLFIIIIKALNVYTICVYVLLVSIICVLLLLNILHSHELTYMPKIILCNDNEDKNSCDFKKLKISRMNKKDTDQIVNTILKEFKYVFEYIFDTSDEITLKRTLCLLLTSCFGFGFLGYMNFYSIQQSDNDTEIGLIKINTLHRCLIYKFFELLSLPIVIISQFGIKKLPQIYKRSKEIIDSQPKLQKRTEFELTYFVIYEEFRNDKYGTYAMKLLVNALFHSKTNNINCSQLTMLVREINTASLLLVRNIGFEQYGIIDNPKEIINSNGKGLLFRYMNNNN
jgi:ribosomal protein S18 acetylase RimI-like enzyme